jgi:molybdopterin adenylyltransferase
MESSVAKSPGNEILRVGVLTISDRSAAGLRDDLSGPAIQRVVVEFDFTVSIAVCIPDDRSQIEQTLKDWADNSLCDCILTTGGTGLATRDITPDATESVLESQLPHLASQIALTGAKTVPTALLSRAIAGTRAKTLIVNLPGSPRGAEDGARIVLPIAKHAVDVLKDDGDLFHI